MAHRMASWPMLRLVTPLHRCPHDISEQPALLVGLDEIVQTQLLRASRDEMACRRISLGQFLSHITTSVTSADLHASRVFDVAARRTLKCSIPGQR